MKFPCPTLFTILLHAKASQSHLAVWFCERTRYCHNRFDKVQLEYVVNYAWLLFTTMMIVTGVVFCCCRFERFRHSCHKKQMTRLTMHYPFRYSNAHTLRYQTANLTGGYVSQTSTNQRKVASINVIKTLFPTLLSLYCSTKATEGVTAKAATWI